MFKLLVVLWLHNNLVHPTSTLRFDQDTDPLSIIRPLEVKYVVLTVLYNDHVVACTSASNLHYDFPPLRQHSTRWKLEFRDSTN